MRTKRPRRLDGAPYVGIQRYFLTTCTAFRRPVFDSADVVEAVLSQLRQACELFGMALIVYCFMPDHLHLLVGANGEDADGASLRQTIQAAHRFRVYKRRMPRPFGSRAIDDRVLRDDEATEAVVRYVLENPIRAGLSRTIGEYSFAGSNVYDLAALLTAWERQT